MQTALYSIRKERQLTQKDMAKKLGISEVAYRNKELGQNQFKQDEMFLLSVFFNKPIDEIFLPRKSPKRKH